MDELSIRRIKNVFTRTETHDFNEFMREIRKLFSHNRYSDKRLRVSIEAPEPDSIPTCLHGIEGLKEIPYYDYTPGIYFLTVGDEIVYIGKSVNPMSRILTHREDKEFERAYLLPIPVKDHNGFEGAMIRLIQPRLNGRNNGIAIEDNYYLDKYLKEWR